MAITRPNPVNRGTDASTPLHQVDQGRPSDVQPGSDSQEIPEFKCRVCFADEPNDDNLIVPCACAGSSMYIHRECLDRWRIEQRRNNNENQCTTCLFKYEYEDSPTQMSEQQRNNRYTWMRRWEILLFIIKVSIIIAIVTCILYFIDFWGLIPRLFSSTNRWLSYITASILVIIFVLGFNSPREGTFSLFNTFVHGMAVAINTSYSHVNTRLEDHRRRIWNNGASMRRVRDFKNNRHDLQHRIRQQEQERHRERQLRRQAVDRRLYEHQEPHLEEGSPDNHQRVGSYQNVSPQVNSSYDRVSPLTPEGSLNRSVLQEVATMVQNQGNNVDAIRNLLNLYSPVPLDDRAFGVFMNNLQMLQG